MGKTDTLVWQTVETDFRGRLRFPAVGARHARVVATKGDREASETVRTAAGKVHEVELTLPK